MCFYLFPLLARNEVPNAVGCWENPSCMQQYSKYLIQEILLWFCGACSIFLCWLQQRLCSHLCHCEQKEYYNWKSPQCNRLDSRRLTATKCHVNIYKKQLYEAEKVLHVEITFKHEATIAVSYLSPARFLGANSVVIIAIARALLVYRSCALNSVGIAG